MTLKTGFIVAAAIAAADEAIKYSIREPLVKNKGFALNKFDDHQRSVAAASLIMTLVSACSMAAASDRNRTGLALILGGALSNTYDRIVRKFVVDYIPIGHVAFNLSDFAIIAGSLITAADAMRE